MRSTLLMFKRNVFTVWVQCELDRFLHVSRASRHHRGMFSLKKHTMLITIYDSKILYCRYFLQCSEGPLLSHTINERSPLAKQ